MRVSSVFAQVNNRPIKGTSLHARNLERIRWIDKLRSLGCNSHISSTRGEAPRLHGIKKSERKSEGKNCVDVCMYLPQFSIKLVEMAPPPRSYATCNLKGHYLGVTFVLYF